MQIVDAFDVLGTDARLFHLFAIDGKAVPDVADLFDESFALPGAKLFAARRFDVGLVVTFHGI